MYQEIPVYEITNADASAFSDISSVFANKATAERCVKERTRRWYEKGISYRVPLQPPLELKSSRLLLRSGVDSISQFEGATVYRVINSETGNASSWFLDSSQAWASPIGLADRESIHLQTAVLLLK